MAAFAHRMEKEVCGAPAYFLNDLHTHAETASACAGKNRDPDPTLKNKMVNTSQQRTNGVPLGCTWALGLVGMAPLPHARVDTPILSP